MRKPLILIWLLLPVLAGAYHLGPGQQKKILDDAAWSLKQADRLEQDGQWALAVEAYDRALELLPAEKVAEARRIRLEKAKAQMLASQLPLAHQGLKGLVDEMMADRAADQTLLAEARSTLANSQYYMTWLMRLEGQPRELWEPEIESARQTYKLLAEEADALHDAENAKRHKEDLESAIRLARMDLKDLQGLPLPSQ